jgi:hypothetical protein
MDAKTIHLRTETADVQQSPKSLVEIPPLPELPACARLYYSGIGERRYKRASTRTGPGEPLVFVSLALDYMRRRDVIWRDKLSDVGSAFIRQRAELEKVNANLLLSARNVLARRADVPS